MTLERGFRRLTTAISMLILGLGITVNIIALKSYAPGATVQVALEDGRTVTVEGSQDRDYLGDRLALERCRRAAASLVSCIRLSVPGYARISDETLSTWRAMSTTLVMVLRAAFAEPVLLPLGRPPAPLCPG